MAEKRIVDINPVLEELKADLLDHESCCEPLTLAEAMKDEIEDLEKLPIIDPESLRGHAKWVKDKELKFIIVDDENDSHEEPATCDRAAAPRESLRGGSTMSDDGMFCPYKKSTKREVSYSWTSRTEITTERFGWCSEKKCMAYNNGRCKRLEREENQ